VDDTQTAKLFKHRGSDHLGAKIGITIVLHTWARRHAPAAGADNADRLPLGRRDEAPAPICRGIGRSCAGRDPGRWRRDREAIAAE